MVINVNDNLAVNFEDPPGSGNLGKPVPWDAISGIPQSLLAHGASIYLATSAYDAATGILTLTPRAPQPASIAFGDVLVFTPPANSLNGNIDIEINDTITTGPRIDLRDTDFTSVKGIHMRPGRAYGIRKLKDTVNPGDFTVYQHLVPLAVEQVVPLRTATFDFDNDRLKTLDDNYQEVIPAPGAGRAIEVLFVRFTVGPGLWDRDAMRTGPPYPDDYHISRMNFVIGYITAGGAAATQPLSGNAHSDPREIIILDSTEAYWMLNRENESFQYTLSSQFLFDNMALTFGWAFTFSRPSIARQYTETAWQGMWARYPTKTLQLQVNYYIRDL